MKRIATCLAAVALGACVTEGPDKPRLDLYDRIQYLSARYDAALDQRDLTEEARVEVSLARLAQQSFETLAQDVADAPGFRRRLLAAFALGFSKRVEAGAPLRARLDDPDPGVRLQAAIALGRLGLPNPPVDRVTRMLDDPNVDTRLGALVALRLMLAPGQDAGLKARLVGLLDDPDQSIRNEVVLLMGRIRKMEFVEPLADKAFKDSFFLVRHNAALMVGSYGAAAEHVRPQLIELLRDLESIVVQAAHWALRQVTGKDFDRSYHTWRDWYEEELTLYEYACVKDVDIVRPVASFCPKCGARLERRLRPILPRREEKKDDKK